MTPWKNYLSSARFFIQVTHKYSVLSGFSPLKCLSDFSLVPDILLLLYLFMQIISNSLCKVESLSHKKSSQINDFYFWWKPHRYSWVLVTCRKQHTILENVSVLLPPYKVCLCSFLLGCTLKFSCTSHFFIAAMQPSTNWHLKENARDHHTSKFSSKELIVRRGQAFIVTFNGTEQPEQNLTFIAETGMAPNFFHRKSNAALWHSFGLICTIGQQDNTSEPTRWVT